MRASTRSSSSCRSGGMSVRIERPIISSAVYPNMRSAAGFHDWTMPFRSLLMIASSEYWTIAASRSDARSSRTIESCLPRGLENETLGTAIRHDLGRVEVALRIRRHVVDDVEFTWLRTTGADGSDLRQRRPIEHRHAHRPGVDDVKVLLFRVR